MENSLDMEFQEWELIPNTNKDVCALNESETKSLSNSKNEDDEALDMECKDAESFSNPENEDDEALDMECKDAESFSNPKNENDEALDMECKDIEVLPHSPSINLSSELDQFNIDSNIKESEEHDLKHEEEEEEEEEEEVYEYYKDEVVLEKEIEYVKSEVKEKQAFWTIGAVCSAAAATICIIVFAGKNNQQHRNNQQKLQVQLYTDEKRIKEVVKQAKMNQALSAIRGATNMTRAHISFGGYYDGI